MKTVVAQKLPQERYLVEMDTQYFRATIDSTRISDYNNWGIFLHSISFQQGASWVGFNNILHSE